MHRGSQGIPGTRARRRQKDRRRCRGEKTKDSLARMMPAINWIDMG